MDGMLVTRVTLVAPARDDEITASGDFLLPAPTATIAEVALSSFNRLYFSNDLTASGVFTNGATDGSNGGLPQLEVFAYGSASGEPREVVVRNGLISISYDLVAKNCVAHFTINLFFWPAVDRGTL